MAIMKTPLFVLTGRNQDVYDIGMCFEKFKGLFDVIIKEPYKWYSKDNAPPNAIFNEWYPKPNGPNDQQNAVEGLITNSKKMAKEFSQYPKIALAGFSAGAVMALEVSFLLDNVEFAIINSGAVLNMDTTRTVKNKTKYFIHHDNRDKVFTWEDRYLPMINYLKHNDVCTKNTNTGMHYLDDTSLTYFLEKIQTSTHI